MLHRALRFVLLLAGHASFSSLASILYGGRKGAERQEGWCLQARGGVKPKRVERAFYKVILGTCQGRESKSHALLPAIIRVKK